MTRSALADTLDGVIMAEYEAAGASGSVPKRSGLWPFLLLVILNVFGGMAAQAGPVVGIESPIGFFTNVASRLLKSELDVNFNQIQVYPTNQYTPSVHRLLQVSANLYDCLTNRSYGTGSNGYPTVFRPVFHRTATEVFISGYEEVVDAPTLLARTVRDLRNTNDLENIGPDDLVSGVPLVIGARKGFPGFNKFGMQTAVQAARRLEFWRDTSSSAWYPYQTNQMIIMGVSNAIGAELWNSYRGACSRPLQASFRADVSAWLAKPSGEIVGSGPAGCYNSFSASNIFAPVTNWSGWIDSFNYPDSTNAFFLLFATPNGWWHLTNSIWRGTAQPEMFDPAQDPATATFDQDGFPIPQLILNIRTRFQCALVDTGVSPQRIVDYVALDSVETAGDISSKLMEGGSCGSPYAPNMSQPSMWCTNRMPGSAANSATYGVMNQIYASLGQGNPNWGLNGDYRYQVDFFRTNFARMGRIYNVNGPVYLTNHFFAPYVPTRTLFYWTEWRINDPLVHYTIGDLEGSETNRYVLFPPSYVLRFGWPPQRYEPWDPFRVTMSSTLADLRVKDPLVTCSDDWDFPVNASPDLSWLGRMHRGTPWQTLYLKSSAVDDATWRQWAGLKDPEESARTHPSNDWRLAALLVSLLTTNIPQDLASPNVGSQTEWRALLDGILTMTNTVSDAQFESNPFQSPEFDTVLMDVGSPQAAVIADAIISAKTAQPAGHFFSAGDILAVPELSVESPWLNTAGEFVRWYGITDAAYEAIPSQLVPRLRSDSAASMVQAGGGFRIRFTGIDACPYAVEVSHNLTTWSAVATNVPYGGVFYFTPMLNQGAESSFYRSVLLR